MFSQKSPVCHFWIDIWLTFCQGSKFVCLTKNDSPCDDNSGEWGKIARDKEWVIHKPSSVFWQGVIIYEYLIKGTSTWQLTLKNTIRIH